MTVIKGEIEHSDMAQQAKEGSSNNRQDDNRLSDSFKQKTGCTKTRRNSRAFSIFVDQVSLQKRLTCPTTAEHVSVKPLEIMSAVGAVIGVVLASLLLIYAWLIHTTVRAEHPSESLQRQKVTVARSQIQMFHEFAAVMTAQECKDIPKKIRLLNGTMADIIVATMTCICAAEVGSCGFGGGLVALVYKASENKVYSLSAKESFPLHAQRSTKLFQQQIFHRYAFQIGVPGFVAGLHSLMNDFGSTLPLEFLFSFARKIATQPRNTSDHLRMSVKKLKERIKGLRTQITHNFSNIDENHSFMSKGLIYDDLARDGLKHFYLGNIASTIVKNLQNLGSSISMKDFISYSSIWKGAIPIQRLFLGMETYTTDYPTGGPVFRLLMLCIREWLRKNGERYFQLKQEFFHHMIECFKFSRGTMSGFVKYFNDLNTSVVESATNEKAARYLSDRISTSKTLAEEAYLQKPDVFLDGGTACLIIRDTNGDVIIVTASLNAPFGSTVYDPTYEFFYNNQLSNFHNMTFDLPSTENKQLLTSMAPFIILHEGMKREPVLAGIASGGSRSMTIQAQFLLHFVWLQRRLSESMSALRLHHQLSPNVLFLETSPSNPAKELLAAQLQKMGHKIADEPLNASYRCMFALCMQNGAIYAALDGRLKTGGIDGY